MKSKYVYSIAIIIVLLVLLFIYNASKGAPTTNSNSSDKPDPGPGPNVDVKTATGATSMQAMCNSLTSAYSFTISITDINNKTISNTITSSSAGTPAVIGSFTIPNSTGSSQTIGGIQYSPTYLNIYKNLIPGDNTSRFAIQDITTYVTSIKDTNSNQIIYDATTGSVLNNTLTFTSGTDSLIITFNDSFK